MAIAQLVFRSLSTLYQPVSCIPIDRTEPSYKSDPDGRGTLSLLYSCTLTFGLCIWTAVHPQIVPWSGFWDQVYYKLCWMLYTALVPELVVATAVSQWMEARKIHKLWRKSFDNQQPEKQWLGMPGAFFVVMGGFVVQENDPIQRSNQSAAHNPNWIRRWGMNNPKDQPCCDDPGLVTTICPAGFRKLLELGIIQELILTRKLTETHFSSDNIKDKGKADGLTKFLTVLQIVWMATQCLARELTGLPVTLLEAHILIQILYSVIIYSFWWHKPLDVGEPIALPLGITELSTELKHDITSVTQDAAPLRDFGTEPENLSIEPPNLITERRQVGELFQMYCRMTYDLMASVPWEPKRKPEKKKAFPLTALTIALGAVNGGLHAIAWNSHFPTGAEQRLWRISSMGTVLFPVVFLSLMADLDAHTAGLHAFYHMRTGGKSRGDGFARAFNYAAESGKMGPFPVRYLRFCVGMLCVFGYLVSITYLTVEAYVSVRSVPEGAYSSVDWWNFLPHY